MSDFDPFYDILDGYDDTWETPGKPTPPPIPNIDPGKWVTIDHDGWIIVGEEKTNFQIVKRHKQYAFLRHIVSGMQQGQRWVQESILLDGDPATVFYDADPTWAPEEP